MVPLLANASPVPVGGRVFIATVGFGLALALARARLARPLRLSRLIGCFVAALCIAASVSKDGLGVFDFLAGACCGVMPWAPSAWELQKPRRSEWAIIATCFGLGPLLSLVTFGVSELFGIHAAVDRTHYLTVFLIIGSCAGLLCALVTSVIVAVSQRHAELTDPMDSRVASSVMDNPSTASH